MPDLKVTSHVLKTTCLVYLAAAHIKDIIGENLWRGINVKIVIKITAHETEESNQILT